MMSDDQSSSPEPLRKRHVSRRNLLSGVAAVLGSAVLAENLGLGGPLTLSAARADTAGALRSNVFDLQVDGRTGGVYTLANPADRYGTNFVLNPTSRASFDVDDSRWFGDLVFGVRRADQTTPTTMVTGLSDASRTVTQNGSTITVTYAGNASATNGIRGFTVVETYALDSTGSVVTWSFTIKNTSTQALEFQDVGFPLLMNSYWSGDQTGIYESNVSRHSFVGQDGSYIYWQRPNGQGPFLVMVPTPGTRLEFKNKARPGEGPFGEVDPAWEGLVEYYIHSKAIAPARAGQAATYLPATSLTLSPGQSKTYGFTFRWAADYTGIRDAVFGAGGLDVVSMPGMVIPTDTTATLAVRASAGITSVVGQSGKGVTITAAGTSANGYNLYKLTFPTLGASTVTVTYGGSRTSVLQYYAIRPVEELITRRAAFIVANQQATTARGYNGAYLQWSMTTRKLVTWDDYPGGGWKEWMAGGSDDLGLGPAEFLAEKNLTSPVQAEISSIDTWITDFLFGYLQSSQANGQRTYQVFRWYDGQDGRPTDTGVWRAYNYTHIANVYYTMYRIARAYPRMTLRYTAAQYLTFCFETLNAMFTKIPLPTPIGDAAHELGLMGESTYPEILAALGAEGLTTQRAQLQQWTRDKYRYFASEAYPFASEASIDTTGFETSYTLAKMNGDIGLVEKVMSASLACRGLQPAWYYYGSDNRHMGESWWNLGYECHLGAWQQQDYLVAYDPSGAPDLADMQRSTYGAYLAGWANINSGQIDGNAANIGAAAWLYQSEKGTTEYSWIPSIDGWWAWSGEADLGFWGGVRAASVNVVRDPILGLYAYGGDVVASSGGYTITPRDGVRNKFTFFNARNLTVRIEHAKYTRATVAEDRSRISITMQNVSGGPYSAVLTVLFLPAGTYTVAVEGVAGTRSVTSDGNPVTITLPSVSAASSVVTVTRV